MKRAVSVLVCVAVLFFGLAKPVAMAEEATQEHPALVDGTFAGAEVVLVQDAPVTEEPVPSGVVAPSSGTDSVTLLIVAAGGFAVGFMAGVMGCCVLFFAYYY